MFFICLVKIAEDTYCLLHVAPLHSLHKNCSHLLPLPPSHNGGADEGASGGQNCNHDCFKMNQSFLGDEFVMREKRIKKWNRRGKSMEGFQVLVLAVSEVQGHSCYTESLIQEC